MFSFSNNVSTSLAAAATSSATVLTLASSANLPSIPSGNVMALTLNDQATRQVFEVVYVTSISGANVTVERAQEGTTAVAWGVGDYAYTGPTAGQMQSLAFINGNNTQIFRVATANGPDQAMPVSQLDATFAALAGSASQVFNVANANATSEAVSLGQLAGSGWASNGGYTTQISTSSSFTASQNCVVLVNGNVGSTQGITGVSLGFSGATVDSNTSNWSGGSNFSTNSLGAATAIIRVTSGTACTITMTANSPGTMSIGFTYLVLPTP